MLFEGHFLLPFKFVIGVAIGAGWQGMVAFVNIGCYYMIGIPLGVVLGYALDMHVKVRRISIKPLPVLF